MTALDADTLAWVLALPTSPAALAPAIAHADAPAPVDTPETPAVAVCAAKASSGGAEAERARLRAILSSEEAKTRPKLALHLALTTDWSSEAVEAALARAGRDTDEKLGGRMAGAPVPAVRPDPPRPAPPHGQTASAQAARVYRSVAAANAAIARKEGGFTLDLSVSDPEVLAR